MVSDLLCQLDTHQSMGLDGIHPRLLRKLLEGLTKPFSVIYQANQGRPRLEVSQYDTHQQGGSEGESEEIQACQPDLGDRKGFRNTSSPVGCKSQE